jgi:phosphohistidine phosphatase
MTDKTIIIIRHAKSSWTSPSLLDFDRPLNDRGHHDAPMMAKRFKARNILVDRWISSTANRAKTTAGYFATEFGSTLQLEPELYHASLGTFRRLIHAFDESWNSVAIFSHNPGITDLVNHLGGGQLRLDNLPTCGMVGFRFSDTRWAAVEQGDFLFFDAPKIA